VTANQFKKPQPQGKVWYQGRFIEDYCPACDSPMPFFPVCYRCGYRNDDSEDDEASKEGRWRGYLGSRGRLLSATRSTGTDVWRSETISERELLTSIIRNSSRNPEAARLRSATNNSWTD
jgi:hypothetical protein